MLGLYGSAWAITRTTTKSELTSDTEARPYSPATASAARSVIRAEALYYRVRVRARARVRPRCRCRSLADQKSSLVAQTIRMESPLFSFLNSFAPETTTCLKRCLEFSSRRSSSRRKGR